MTEPVPPPPRRCPTCGGGHYAPVRYCPFCGARQAEPAPPEPEPAPPPAAPPPAPPPAAPPPAVEARHGAGAAPPEAPPRPSARAASPVPPVAPRPEPAAPQPTAPARLRPRRRFRFGWRQAGLAGLAIAGLSMLALRQGPAAPARIVVGPAWTAVALGPYRGTALLRLTADAPFSLRLDGTQVTRAVPGGGAVVRPDSLRSLELRAGRGQVTVTLTPRGE